MQKLRLTPDSPVYALRSYLYIGLHALVGRALHFIVSVFSLNKVQVGGNACSYPSCSCSHFMRCGSSLASPQLQRKPCFIAVCTLKVGRASLPMQVFGPALETMWAFTQRCSWSSALACGFPPLVDLALYSVFCHTDPDPSIPAVVLLHVLAHDLVRVVAQRCRLFCMDSRFMCTYSLRAGLACSILQRHCWMAICCADLCATWH